MRILANKDIRKDVYKRQGCDRQGEPGAAFLPHAGQDKAYHLSLIHIWSQAAALSSVFMDRVRAFV